ncbi:MAG: PAS domain-containing protein [Solirubrobacteraceae bacterium]|nr:PAS domain-containing protein [Solirubrobacteraceae bacterium]
MSPSGDDGRIVTLRDISERVEVQTSLRKGSERLALDGPDARVGSWEWNFVAGTVQWSDQLYRIYGFEPRAFEPTYERYLSLVHPEDRAGIEAIHRKALADHQPFADIKRMHRADRVEILVRTDGEIILAADGTPLRMIGVSEDVSDYERTRALLAAGPRL